MNKLTKLECIVTVNQKLLNMIDNLENGRFKIIMTDDGKETDVTKDNIKTMQYMQKLLDEVLHIDQ